MLGHEKTLFDFLENLGCKEHPHGDKTLFDHLVGTYKILLEEEAPWEVALAGLFHAVYGTTSYPIAVVEHGDREKVRSMIGKWPEEIAFLFGTMALPRLEHIEKFESPEIREAILMINNANALEMEQLPDNVIPFEPKGKPQEPFPQGTTPEDVYEDMAAEMKFTIHDEVRSMWERRMVDRISIDEDVHVAEALARFLCYQAIISLAADYALMIDKKPELYFLPVGSAKDLFLEFYSEEMEEEYDG